MKLAYADPPYPGRAHLYRYHPDYAGEVDHPTLIRSLGQYDGWALATSADALRWLLPLCASDIRVLAWVKCTVNVSWEPVIVRSARPINPQGGPRDWIQAEPEAFQWRPKPDSYVIGQKPAAFCRWMFHWLGADPDDTFDDLFPGSGAVGQEWDRWSPQPSLLAVPSERQQRRAPCADAEAASDAGQFDMSTPLVEAIDQRLNQLQIDEDRIRLPGSLYEFTREAFHVIKPGRPFKENWHMQVVAAHLEAVTAGDIKRLQIWQPPGTMKSMNVHVFWPAWEWITAPHLRYWCASHSLSLVWQHCDNTGTLLKSGWFQDRWPLEMWTASKTGYENVQGGTRITTSPGSEGVGKHGDRIIIDDLLDAGDAESTTRAVLDFTNEWYDAVITGRKETDAAEVLIMQRLHEDDIAAHALEVGDWTVLCLPEKFENDHPHRWTGSNVHPAVAERLAGTGLEHGDPREDGDLLWPDHRNHQQSAEYARRLKAHRAAGQLQQRPAAREGDMLKVAWWRFYDPEIRRTDKWKDLPKFRTIVISVDTPLKDKEQSDNVAIQCYGSKGADRYLLDLRLGKMSKAAARRQIVEMWRWARKQFPGRPIYVLIENAGYGVELIDELKREISGVTKISAGPEGNKILRAESASDALESGNYFLPGYGPPWQPAYDETKSPADIAAFVHNLALFPNVKHDDDVDAWSQYGIWIGKRNTVPARTISPFKNRQAPALIRPTGR